MKKGVSKKPKSPTAPAKEEKTVTPDGIADHQTAIQHPAPPTKAEDPDVTELELLLVETGKISPYIMLPSDIIKIWRSTR